MLRKKYKTFKKKNSENTWNSKFMQIFLYVAIKKRHDKERSEYNINPSRATNHRVERLNALTLIIEQWRSLIVASDIHSKCY